MATNLSDVKGMHVFDPNNEKVGTVADVFAVPALGHSSFDSDPAGEGRILKVERGGIFGIGATDLYIPVKDVQSVVPGEYLTINCRKDVCDNLYAEKPDVMSVMDRADDDFPPGT
jgi:hypothetical protein